jgi:hypothetical protein
MDKAQGTRYKVQGRFKGEERERRKARSKGKRGAGELVTNVWHFYSAN